MIDGNIYINTEQLNSSKIFLTALKNLSAPESTYSANKSSFGDGRKVYFGGFSSYKFITEWMIVGDSASDLATQRNNFLEIIGKIAYQTTSTFKLTRADSVSLQIDVKAFSISGDLKAEMPFASNILVTFEAEYPFLTSQTLKEETINVYYGGGMSIPMSIPMSMGVGGSNAVVIDHLGNYNALPILKIYGPLNTFSIANVTTDKQLSCTYNLTTSADYIEIDIFNRTALLNGITNVRSYISGDFFTLIPGNNEIHLTGVGTGYCVLSYRDTYIGV